MTKHTLAELLTMPASELDRIAAEVVMGWIKRLGYPRHEFWFDATGNQKGLATPINPFTPDDLETWHPSTDHNDAAMLRAKIAERGLHNVYIGKLLLMLNLRPNVLTAWDCANATPRQTTIACILAAQEK